MPSDKASSKNNERPDFTGYWVLSKTEQFDEFLRALSVPWIVRKAAIQFATNAIDIIAHQGNTVRITSLNAKGSWNRSYDTSKTIEQPNAEGVLCKTTTWWEGGVLRSRLEGSSLGVCNSWRYRRGDTLVVKSSIKSQDRPEAVCFWFFERMQALQRHMGGAHHGMLLRSITTDQNQIAQATRKDSIYLQHLLLDFERWTSPADDFIRISSSSSSVPLVGFSRKGSSLRLRHRYPGGGTGGAVSPNASPSQGMSKSPSTSSVSTMNSPSNANNDINRSLGHDISLGRDTLPSKVNSAHQHQLHPPPKPPTFPAASTDDITFPSLKPTELASPLVAKPASSDDPDGLKKIRSSENIGAMAAAAAATVSKRSLHYRSPSTDSIASVPISQALTPGRHSPSDRQPPTGAEALMVLKLHEFLDSRGILAVVPVTNPNDTSEPQLLSMSPEQAEETAAKLRELETDMLLRRQNWAKGVTCCGIVLTRKKDSIPDHLRVWEMTLI